MSKLCIKSDFTDFYDKLGDNTSPIVYNRFLNQSKQRGASLKYLRSIGIRTLELQQVNNFFRGDGPIVVYTDPKAHHGQGKKIMSVDEAMQTYGNCIASNYYNTDGLTIKYLQIGKRRFTLCFKKDETYTLDTGKLISVSESEPEYNRLIGLPIYSIDYISNGQVMIATDFNEVEDLKSLGMDNYISADDVIREITESLIVYNKI